MNVKVPLRKSGTEMPDWPNIRQKSHVCVPRLGKIRSESEEEAQVVDESPADLPSINQGGVCVGAIVQLAGPPFIAHNAD
jgi:hypothetical protein